jgi:phosphonoacetaldehyde hydrolase
VRDQVSPADGLCQLRSVMVRCNPGSSPRNRALQSYCEVGLETSQAAVNITAVMRNPPFTGVKLVVFDWTGTLIDHGGLAPVQAMLAMFANAGIGVTAAQVRCSMGLNKRQHIEAILRIPTVLRSFQSAYGREPEAADVDKLYEIYVPAQLKAIQRFGELIDGAAASSAFLRERGIAVATTTGYFRSAAERLLECARRQGFAPDYAACSDDVSAGRPAPYMIYACMQALQVYRASEVLVVGDTVSDIVAAANGGCTSVGVAGTGNEVGLTQAAFGALQVRKRNALLANAHRTLRDAGADFVIDTLFELPLVVSRIEERAIHSAA